MEGSTRKLIAMDWVSLDGVFDADTMDQWFNPYLTDERSRLIQECIDGTGAFLIGRVTYQMFAAYWPTQKNNEFGIADRMNRLPKHVVSRTLRAADWSNSHLVAGDLGEAVRTLKRQPGQDILMPGSASLLWSLLPLGLVDEILLLVHPIVAGKGKRLFRDLPGPTRLELLESRALPAGVLALRYRPSR
jgi:dihydrofolate reductase